MRWLVVAAALLVASAAHAHANGSSLLRVDSRDEAGPLAVSWEIPSDDLDFSLELDAGGDGRLTDAEILARRAAIARFAISRLEIRRGAGQCRLTETGVALVPRESGDRVTLALSGRCPSVGRLEVSTALFFGSAGYRALLDVETARGRYPAALSAGSPAWQEPAAPSAAASFLRFLREGIWHVLIGYDHILFLLLLVLPAVLRGSRAGWEPIASRREAVADLLRIITAFTLAHSVTLGLAASGVLVLPVRPVEAAIAASIVAAGLLNLFPSAARHRLWLALGFGLVHGFGFANALKSIAADGVRLVPLLGGFNLGVEIAQLAIVAIALPVLWLASRGARYPRQVMPALSLVAAVIGAFWLGGRL